MTRRTFSRPAGRVDYVCNKSSRHGVKPCVVVMHTTQSHERPGRGDVDSIHNYFDTPASQASSHVIVDRESHSTTCVPDSLKAWTQGNANPYCLSIEMIGLAETKRWQWLTYNRQLKKAAKFTAFWCKKYDIPVRKHPRSGICGHVDLSGPGGHWDPGPDFPYDRFLRYVRYYHTNGWAP